MSSLNLSCQNVKHLPNLDGVKWLWCNQNKFRQIPKLLDVQDFYFNNNRIKSCKRFVNSVFSGQLSDNKIKDFSYFRYLIRNKYLKYLI